MAELPVFWYAGGGKTDYPGFKARKNKLQAAAGSIVSKELESGHSVYAGNIRKKDNINWLN